MISETYYLPDAQYNVNEAVDGNVRIRKINRNNETRELFVHRNALIAMVADLVRESRIRELEGMTAHEILDI